MSSPVVQLPQPALVDLSDNKSQATVHIKTRVHKFASDAAPSGTKPKVHPIFGSVAYVGGKRVSTINYGLPVFRFKRGQQPHVKLINKTGYTFNLHWHGLNTTADVDGASTQVIFGEGTSIGPTLDLHFPTIHNNSGLLWLHAHPMFSTLPFIYTGLSGLVDIVDDASAEVNRLFKYGDNRLLLKYADVDLQADGTYTLENTNTDGNRSCFGLINGISCIDWYSFNPRKPFFNRLCHTTSQPLVKVDVLNASTTWRVLYLGVCNAKAEIQSFYQVQSDTGLINPTELKMIVVAPASRVAIVFHLSNFADGVASLFAYNYDLTEVFDATAVHPEHAQSDLVSPVPDLQKSRNPSPYPTPIPSSPEKQPNQQGDESALSYPIVPLIPQVSQRLQNGTIVPPQLTGVPFSIKPFLVISCSCSDKHPHRSTLDQALTTIRQVVFGKRNYAAFKKLIDRPGFEYQAGVDYLSLLNRHYFYNLPDLSPDVPFRNLILFSDNNENSPPIAPFGSTEYCDGVNRIVGDMWNSAELDLNYALTQFEQSPDNFKPGVLPTCLFSITPGNKTTLPFSNLAMLVNDTLLVELFDTPIDYADESTKPIASAEIVFPPTRPTKPLNIRQWTALVNAEFDKARLVFTNSTLIKPKKRRLSKVLQFDWTFYPFKVDAVYAKTWIFKSVVLKTTNLSKFHVRLSARWPLLQLFGKSMAGGTIMGGVCGKKPKQPNSTSLVAQRRHALAQQTDKMHRHTHNLDMRIQSIFPQYATSDPDVQIPLVDPKENAEMIIAPKQMFRGFVDGFDNDNFKNFAVKLRSSEQWIYTNGDNADSHPVHFHATSGFVSVAQAGNSPGLVSAERAYASLLCSKETYGIGPQQTLGFNLKFLHYTSNESALQPPVRGLGYQYHCHFALHETENSMMIEYFIYDGERKEWFDAS